MGNCFGHKSSTSWAGDDWGSPLTDKLAVRSNYEEESLLEKTSSVSNSSSSSEIKIRVPKKQLEELLGRVEVQGLSVEQVVAQLMKVSDSIGEQRSWRPALQSIPEVN